MYDSHGPVTQSNVGMTRGEVWVRNLRDKGALGWKDESCHFLMMPRES
jgi:hypothetical protein